MIEASSMNLTHGDPPNQWRWRFFLPMASLWDFTVEVGACAFQVVGYIALAFGCMFVMVVDLRCCSCGQKVVLPTPVRSPRS
jgi:hypothetical protein